MPVIRGEATATVITAESRRDMSDRLKRELSGETVSEGLVIFEIPIQGSQKFDVLVVWDAWKPFGSEARSEVILDAYGDRQPEIAQALGVTHQEAIEQQVLPYAVIPMVRNIEGDPEKLKRAMIGEGGYPLANGEVELRLPTMGLAERAHRRLSDSYPKGYWSIVQNIASFS